MESRELPLEPLLLYLLEVSRNAMDILDDPLRREQCAREFTSKLQSHSLESVSSELERGLVDRLSTLSASRDALERNKELEFVTAVKAGFLCVLSAQVLQQDGEIGTLFEDFDNLLEEILDPEAALSEDSENAQESSSDDSEGVPEVDEYGDNLPQFVDEGEPGDIKVPVSSSPPTAILTYPTEGGRGTENVRIPPEPTAALPDVPGPSHPDSERKKPRVYWWRRIPVRRPKKERRPVEPPEQIPENEPPGDGQLIPIELSAANDEKGELENRDIPVEGSEPLPIDEPGLPGNPPEFPSSHQQEHIGHEPSTTVPTESLESGRDVTAPRETRAPVAPIVDPIQVPEPPQIIIPPESEQPARISGPEPSLEVLIEPPALIDEEEEPQPGTSNAAGEEIDFELPPLPYPDPGSRARRRRRRPTIDPVTQLSPDFIKKCIRDKGRLSLSSAEYRTKYLLEKYSKFETAKDLFGITSFLGNRSRSLQDWMVKRLATMKTIKKVPEIEQPTGENETRSLSPHWDLPEPPHLYSASQEPEQGDAPQEPPADDEILPSIDVSIPPSGLEEPELTTAPETAETQIPGAPGDPVQTAEASQVLQQPAPRKPRPYWRTDRPRHRRRRRPVVDDPDGELPGNEQLIPGQPPAPDGEESSAIDGNDVKSTDTSRIRSGASVAGIVPTGYRSLDERTSVENSSRRNMASTTFRSIMNESPPTLIPITVPVTTRDTTGLQLPELPTMPGMESPPRSSEGRTEEEREADLMTALILRKANKIFRSGSLRMRYACLSDVLAELEYTDHVPGAFSLVISLSERRRVLLIQDPQTKNEIFIFPRGQASEQRLDVVPAT